MNMPTLVGWGGYSMRLRHCTMEAFFIDVNHVVNSISFRVYLLHTSHMSRSNPNSTHSILSLSSFFPFVRRAGLLSFHLRIQLGTKLICFMFDRTQIDGNVEEQESYPSASNCEMRWQQRNKAESTNAITWTIRRCYDAENHIYDGKTMSFFQL